MVNSIKNHISNSKLLQQFCKKLGENTHIEPLIISKIPKHIRPFCRLVNHEKDTITISCSQAAYLTELHYFKPTLISALNRTNTMKEKVKHIIWRPAL